MSKAAPAKAKARAQPAAYATLPKGAPQMQRKAPRPQPKPAPKPATNPPKPTATPKQPSQRTRMLRAVTAYHGSKTSGYAADIVPERAATGMGTAVPVATASGAQFGRVPPGVRQYHAKYEVVELDEAMSRMKARVKGTLPPIEGGLDFSGDEFPATETPAGELDPFDSQGDRGTETGERPIEPVFEDRPHAFAPAPERAPQPRPASKAEAFIRQRIRVSIELPDTTLMVSAVSVVLSRYGALLLLPSTGDQGTFIPKPGSELTLSWDDKVVRCYFPGGAFELEELGLLGLSFIRADE